MNEFPFCNSLRSSLSNASSLLSLSQSSLISRSATETDDVLENKELSTETAKMLAFALDKVEKYTSTTSLANDYSKHYHKSGEEEDGFPARTSVTFERAGSGYARQNSTARTPEQARAMVKLTKSLPGRTPTEAERWDISRVRTASDLHKPSTATSASPILGRTLSRQGSMKLSMKPGSPVNFPSPGPEQRGLHSPQREKDEADVEPPTSNFVEVHEASSCEEMWMQSYGSDMHKYSSVSLWADTAHAEASTLVDSQTLPASALAAMSAQLLVDMEHRLVSTHGPIVHDVIDEVLSAVFILNDSEGKPTCDAAKKVREILENTTYKRRLASPVANAVLTS